MTDIAQPADLLAEPVWPTTPDTTTETPPDGENGDADKANGDAPLNSDKADAEADKAQEAEKDKAKEPEKKEDAPDTKPKEPPVRGKTKTDYILERKQAKLEKAKRAEIARIDKQLSEAGVESDDDEDDSDLAPEDDAALEKAVQKRVGPYIEQIEQQRFNNEVNEFLQSHEIAKLATPAEIATFKTYAAHPSRANVPFETVLLEAVGYRRMMQIGAAQEREAAKKAGASKVGASVAGAEKLADKAATPDVSQMTDAQFEEYQNSIMHRRRG